jgi:hypothetical protein
MSDVGACLQLITSKASTAADEEVRTSDANVEKDRHFSIVLSHHCCNCWMVVHSPPHVER